MKLKNYIVEAPTRGLQTYVIQARTAREAARLVRDGLGEAVSHETVWEGEPRAYLDNPRGDFRSDRERAEG